jgi:hypothetical protein
MPDDIDMPTPTDQKVARRVPDADTGGKPTRAAGRQARGPDQFRLD